MCYKARARNDRCAECPSPFACVTGQWILDCQPPHLWRRWPTLALGAFHYCRLGYDVAPLRAQTCLCTRTTALVAPAAACLCCEGKTTSLLKPSDGTSHTSGLIAGRLPGCEHRERRPLPRRPRGRPGPPHLEVPAEILALGPQPGDVLQRGAQLQPDPLQGKRQRERPSARPGPARPASLGPRRGSYLPP